MEIKRIFSLIICLIESKLYGLDQNCQNLIMLLAAYHVIYTCQAENIGKVSIRRLKKRRLCKQVFNCVKGNVCDNLKDYFEIMSTTHKMLTWY